MYIQALFVLFVGLTLVLPIAFAQTHPNNLQNELEYKKMTDKCPKPEFTEYYRTWSCGEYKIDHGEVRRVFNLNLSEQLTLDIGGGKVFNSWTFNKTIPGPTMRMTEGDLITIYVHNPRESQFPHSLHMHSIHPSGFDGAGYDREVHFIKPGVTGQYIFTAMPAGVYPYHCHIDPVDVHINRGLYGMMIIDPPQPREKANEMFILMSSYDLDGDKHNENYAINGIIDQHDRIPIPVYLGELNRIYLVNMIEYRDVASFHIHALMGNYWPSGTLNSSMIYSDIFTLAQGDRGVLEFTAYHPNTFMMHPHQNDMAALGGTFFIDVIKR